MPRSHERLRAPRRSDRPHGTGSRTAALGRVLARCGRDAGRGLCDPRGPGGGGARAADAGRSSRTIARAGHPPVAGRSTVNASYPEHLREEVERHLRGMRFSAEPLTAGLEEAMLYSLLA